ncbi:HipA N-terminal domain-containing protein [Methanimicrococcus sp. OttesenSCG-928-J09]|nr:HipA N-terminal domain-containing protein [Methanimicrococcus sp. OttesenSCG-928-J09]
MKQAEIFASDLPAGILTENEDGFLFQYHDEYLQNEKAEPISLTLPLQKMPFKNDSLFPFFDGLIPEGWLLDIAETNWKISSRDRMSLLLACCRNCIGTVSVIPIENNKEEE